MENSIISFNSREDFDKVLSFLQLHLKFSDDDLVQYRRWWTYYETNTSLRLDHNLSLSYSNYRKYSIYRSELCKNHTYYTAEEFLIEFSQRSKTIEEMLENLDNKIELMEEKLKTTSYEAD